MTLKYEMTETALYRKGFNRRKTKNREYLTLRHGGFSIIYEIPKGDNYPEFRRMSYHGNKVDRDLMDRLSFILLQDEFRTQRNVGNLMTILRGVSE